MAESFLSYSIFAFTPSISVWFWLLNPNPIGHRCTQGGAGDKSGPTPQNFHNTCSYKANKPPKKCTLPQKFTQLLQMVPSVSKIGKQPMDPCPRFSNHVHLWPLASRLDFPHW